ncbi:MAG TPA: hypothetical protein VJH70_03325 [Candidatus Paceibacterota bacterium]
MQSKNSIVPSAFVSPEVFVGDIDLKSLFAETEEVKGDDFYSSRRVQQLERYPEGRRCKQCQAFLRSTNGDDTCSPCQDK